MSRTFASAAFASVVALGAVVAFCDVARANVRDPAPDGVSATGRATGKSVDKPAKPVASKPVSSKPVSSKTASGKSDSGKTESAKSGSAKPVASKPASAPLQLHKPVRAATAAPVAPAPDSAAAAAPAVRVSASERANRDKLTALIERHASNHGVPSALAHRVVMRESRYNPAARNRIYWGLMQIRHDTARSLGYNGPAEGLLDPDVNLRYGMAYLGNAYRVAGGDQSRAVLFYSRGFYYDAKRKGMLGQLRKGDSAPVVEANAR